MDYEANDGHEVFLRYMTPDNRLISLLRLRIPSWFFPEKNPGKPIFKNLKNCAFIRELHTYGELTPVLRKGNSSQHRGFGKKLLEVAEEIVRKQYDIPRLAVISGIGVKEYYRKLGYHDEATYMIKNL
jgi:elongator complex protein 3